MTVGVGQRVVKELTTLVMSSNTRNNQSDVTCTSRQKAGNRLERLFEYSGKEFGNIRVLVSVVVPGGGGTDEEIRPGLLDGGGGGGGGTEELVLFLKMTGP